MYKNDNLRYNMKHMSLSTFYKAFRTVYPFVKIRRKKSVTGIFSSVMYIYICFVLKITTRKMQRLCHFGGASSQTSKWKETGATRRVSCGAQAWIYERTAFLLWVINLIFKHIRTCIHIHTLFIYMY